jgi:hypothetical protein
MVLIWEATSQVWLLFPDPGRSDATRRFRHALNLSPTLAVVVAFARTTVPYIRKGYTSPKIPIVGRRAEFPTVPQRQSSIPLCLLHHFSQLAEAQPLAAQSKLAYNWPWYRLDLSLSITIREPRFDNPPDYDLSYPLCRLHLRRPLHKLRLLILNRRISIKLLLPSTHPPLVK